VVKSASVGGWWAEVGHCKDPGPRPRDRKKLGGDFGRHLFLLVGSEAPQHAKAGRIRLPVEAGTPDQPGFRLCQRREAKYCPRGARMVDDLDLEAVLFGPRGDREARHVSVDNVFRNAAMLLDPPRTNQIDLHPNDQRRSHGESRRGAEHTRHHMPVARFPSRKTTPT
jgi:hypothetical protein